MNLGSIGKKEIFKAINASVSKGANLAAARKIAATEFDIARGKMGKIPKSQAIALTKRLKSEHLFKPRVGVDKISTSGATAKRILKEVIAPKDAGMGALTPKEERAAHVEEKRQVLKEAGLKESAANINHEAKPIIQKALDMVSLNELETGKVDTSDLHKSAAQTLSLRATVVVPHRQQEKTVVVVPQNERPVSNDEELGKEEGRAEPLPPVSNVAPPASPEPAPAKAVDPFGD